MARPPACSRMRLLPVALALPAIIMYQAGCGLKSQEITSKEAAQTATQPGLFTVAQEQLPQLHVAPVQRADWSIAVRTTGTVDWDEDQTTQAITQVNGPISRILVDTGTKVKQGDPLLYVNSTDVAEAISNYRKAKNRETLAKRVLDREKELLDRGAAAVKDYESTEADYNDAMTDVENSLQPLRIFGITKEEIDQTYQQGKAISPELAVRAPISGTVVQKLVSPGMVIEAGTTVCFVLSDVSSVWVQGHIFDGDLPNVRVGDVVEETNPSLGRVFHGKVAYIGASVDPATRTTPVRIVTGNPDGILKKDMFVEAVIHTASRKNILTVPVSAVLRDAENEPIVFVQAEPGKFAQRQVTVGLRQNESVELLSGVKEGEPVVAEGSLFLQFANSFQ